jgi:hypothetical protein
MGQLSGSIGAWLPAIDPVTGTLALPMWLAAVIAALLVASGLVLVGRGGPDRIVERLSRAGLVLIGAAAAWIVFDTASADRSASERRSLDARLLAITTQAVAPGSALSCLGGTAGEAVEIACEKALFATPEAAAAAVAYVAAQISILADGADYERQSGSSYVSMLAGVRQAVETDRFGIVAHVLAVRDGCTVEQCGAFALLRDPTRVSDNLVSHRYEVLVAHHSAEWTGTTAGQPAPVAANIPAVAPALFPTASAAPATPPGPTSKKNLFFPSSTSIPPESIMAPEPKGRPQAAADAPAKPATAPAARKGAAPLPLTRPGGAGPSATAPAPTAPAASSRPAPGQASD